MAGNGRTCFDGSPVADDGWRKGQRERAPVSTFQTGPVSISEAATAGVSNRRAFHLTVRRNRKAFFSGVGSRPT